MNHSDLPMEDEEDPLVVDLTTTLGDLLSLQEEGGAEEEEVEYKWYFKLHFTLIFVKKTCIM